MIAAGVFHDRLNNSCKPCEFWKGVCLKGHALQSPLGCPLKKFPPVEGADYLPDLPVPTPPPDVQTPRPCCTGDEAPIPDLSWAEVFTHFQKSVREWKAAGMPITPDDVYSERVETCKRCPRYLWFHCRVCKCIVHSKAKLLTETCPENRWLR